jgi:hypothetical protein
MGKKSRTKWERRRARLLELPGTLGMMVRSILQFGKPPHGRAKKTVPLRNAWWLRDQHLAGGKYPKQRALYFGAAFLPDGPPAHIPLEGDLSFPVFPSAAAMMKHFQDEKEP